MPDTVGDLQTDRAELIAAAKASRSDRKIRRAIQQAGIGTEHFTRRSNDLLMTRNSGPDPDPVLSIKPPGSARSSRPRLRRATEAEGIAYA